MLFLGESSRGLRCELGCVGEMMCPSALDCVNEGDADVSKIRAKQVHNVGFFSPRLSIF